MVKCFEKIIRVSLTENYPQVVINNGTVRWIARQCADELEKQLEARILYILNKTDWLNMSNVELAERLAVGV